MTWGVNVIGSRQRIGNFVSLPTIGLCLDGVQIMNSNTYTYLGVHFDSFLTFDKMTDKICNKLKEKCESVTTDSH